MLCLQTAEMKRVLFKESVYQSSADTYYTLYTWGSGPIVLLLHDWSASAAQVAPLAQHLVRAGFQVMAVDALAHGDSPGRQTDLNEFIEVIKDLHQKNGGFHAILAFSLGAVAAVMALQQGVEVKRLVVCSAAASIDTYLREFTSAIGVSRQTMGRISTLINTRMRRNIKDFSIINIVPTLGMPALIVHDKHDDVVKFAEAVTLSNLWPSSVLLQTEGCGHHGALAHATVVARIVDYIVGTQRQTGDVGLDIGSTATGRT